MSRTATTRAAMVQAMLEITAPLEGSMLDGAEVFDTSGPIKLLSIPEGFKLTTAAVSVALPRMVHRGMIYGDADTHDEAVEVLPPKVRTNLQRWVWSQPWAPEDFDRLHTAHPELIMSDQDKQEIAAELWDSYADYTRTVSPYDMAMSFETAVFLLHLCRTTKPKSIADYGSGYSSFLIRHYALDAGITDITSVDDDGSWLVKSIGFATRHKVDKVGTFKHWNLCRENLPAADIVFHDLAGGDMRNVTMRPVMGSAQRFAVVDDCQVDHHRETFYGLAAELGFEPYALLQTNDHIQRYASLAVKL